VIFEEVATFEKLAALAGTNVKVMQRIMGKLCTIIEVDLSSEYDHLNMNGIKVLLEGEVEHTWYASNFTFLLQP